MSKEMIFCPECEKGNLIPRNEAHKVRIGKNRYALSDPVNFLECDKCKETIFFIKESNKADSTAAKNILREVLSLKRDLNGEDISFLRTVGDISARELSQRLKLDDSAVSQWETRNTSLSFPTALAVAIFFLRKLISDKSEMEKELSKLLQLAFDKDAA